MDITNFSPAVVLAKYPKEQRTFIKEFFAYGFRADIEADRLINGDESAAKFEAAVISLGWKLAPRPHGSAIRTNPLPSSGSRK